MIYVDSCVPMYLVGAEHPNKRRVLTLVQSLVVARERLVTSAETFQEILHRYRALRDLEHLHHAYEALESMVFATFGVEKADVDLARVHVERHPGLSSRDALHLAVMRRIECDRIWTYDQRFDAVPGLVRVH